MKAFRKLGEFFEAPNGRLDLKQVVGLLAGLTLCWSVMDRQLTRSPTDAQVWGLLVVVIMWYAGDVKTAGDAIRAAAGGFRVPDTTTQVQGDLNATTTATGEGTTINVPVTPTETPTTTNAD